MTAIDTDLVVTRLEEAGITMLVMAQRGQAPTTTIFRTPAPSRLVAFRSRPSEAKAEPWRTALESYGR